MGSAGFCEDQGPLGGSGLLHFLEAKLQGGGESFGLGFDSNAEALIDKFFEVLDLFEEV